MKLIQFELIKTIKSKGVKVICFVLIIASVALGFIIADKPSYNVDVIDGIIEEYNNSPEQVTEFYKDLQEQCEEYFDLIYSQTNNDIDIPNLIIEYEYYRLAFERINRQKNYIEKLDSTIKELKKQQSSVGEKQYAINEMLESIYIRNCSLKLGNKDMYGLENLFKLLSYLLFPCMFVGAYIGITVTFNDRQRGNEFLIHSTVLGRKHLLFSKIAVCIIFCTVFCVLSVIVSVFSFSIACDFTIFNEYIQNSISFALYPLPLRVFETIIIVMLLIVLSSTFVSVMACAVGRFSKNRIFPLVTSALIIVVSFFFRIGNRNLAGSLLNISTLFKMCDGNVLFSHIFPIVIGKTVIYGILIVPIVYFLLIVIAIMLYVFYRLEATENKIIKFPSFSLRRNKYKIKNIYVYELKKQLFANKALLLLVIAIFIKSYVSFTMYSFNPSYIETKYRSYITSIQGEYSSEKHELVKQEIDELYETIEKKDQMEQKYRNGEITRNEMGKYLVDFYEAEQNEKALQEVNEYLDYIKMQTDNGKNPSIVYDKGWNKLFTSKIDVLQIVLIVGAMCGIYSDENRRGMNRLYSVCNYKALHKSKIVFCVAFSVFSVIIFCCIDSIIIAENFSLPLLLAQASSIKGVLYLNSFSLLVCAIIRLFAKCFFVSVFSILIVFLSYITKNKVLTFLLSLLVVLAVLLV